ncbi:twin-arginine translocation pathway signal protein [Jannaschia aquimarina]|uniref:Formate dehydrogenase region TAT target n=1 Tax=Jannaschia aquimarina TaxID=935700 RepID=A0A0D1EFQ0_9RHOB|nr:twin-arginine translocation pathway signal protein [Jannaschia aquimarina]KIT15711.1 hypothetical protein jaqu_25880 [Jannaschia aquimarina]SNT38830.1 formate dehydrogenase region TAT target [Jannaschia aquimarina]
MSDTSNPTRRGMLKAAVAAAPAAAIVTATGQAAQAAEPDLTDERMQDTAHTRAYYASARF